MSVQSLVRQFICWSLVLLCACLFSVCSADRAAAESPEPAAKTISETLRADIGYLASEELRGRSVADDSIDVAAGYVADRMSKIGLDMTAMDGAAYQPVPIQLEARAGAAAENFVRFHLEGPGENGGASSDIVANLGSDMNPMSVGVFSGNVQGPVAFVGYGITAPEYGYDDYAGIDVTNRVVVILRKEPQVADPDSIFEGAKNSRHAYFPNKIQNAIENGARAIIFVNDAKSAGAELQQQQNRIDGEMSRKEQVAQQRDALPAEAINNRETLASKIEGIDLMVASMQVELNSTRRGLMGIVTAGNRNPDQEAVPVVAISRTMLDQLLQKSLGKSLASIEKQIDDETKPRSSQLANVAVDLRCEISPTTRVSSNVVGVMHGRGRLAGETVVVGAHYDHVGMGGVGSLAPGTIEIHNGADDNASGTATMLAVAQILKSRLSELAEHRRVVFIAFTGEERGLLGSKYYVRHPRFPLESTVAMVNLDMVGRLQDNDLTVYGTGSSDVMDGIVEQANAAMVARGGEFNLFKVPTGYGPSDHQSFYEARIPVLFFFTGLHNDYHRPSDDSDKIDFGGLTRITDIVSESSIQLAKLSQRPRYTETEAKFKMRWQTTAILGVSLSNRDQGQGVAISSVLADGPANNAGIQIGDQLIQIGRRQVNRPGDVLDSMRGRRPGDKLKLQIRRGGELLGLTVVLAPAR